MTILVRSFADLESDPAVADCPGSNNEYKEQVIRHSTRLFVSFTPDLRIIYVVEVLIS